jgi:Zn-dependent M28 family amino/carboxypeptidase
MAHLDTYAPMSDADIDNNLGGLTLQGMDDNAAGLGVMLELAERMKNVPTKYGIRFVATSGEEEGKLGAENILKRMSAEEKKNTLLVINLDNLIVGDKLYFNSGQSTLAPCVNSRETGRWPLPVIRVCMLPAILAATRRIQKEPPVVPTVKYSTKRVFRYCTLRPLTGRWARKMAINSVPNRKPSRTGQAGMTSDWIISSTLIARYRKN